VYLPLFGEHAASNAAAAVVAFEAFQRAALDEGRVRDGVAAVRWPGRMEVVGRKPMIMLDGAHNPAGAEALSIALREAFAWDELHLVITVSADKDVGGIAGQLAPLADHVYAARNASERTGEALPIAEAFAAHDRTVTTFPDVASALGAARAAAGEDDLILVTGSLYTVADARRALGLAR
jgi:folylpolyglutamate synthase/dihydropteroate synthase